MVDQRRNMSNVASIKEYREPHESGVGASATSLRNNARQLSDPPALLTLAMIRRYYLPLGSRTVFRMISSGQFPKADIGIGGKVRLWKRQTIEQWIATRPPAR
jgi:predicted DNA-binding transcriptional regulator AlpA